MDDLRCIQWNVQLVSTQITKGINNETKYTNKNNPIKKLTENNDG